MATNGGETSRRVFGGLPWGNDELVVVDSAGGVYRGTEAFVMALWALDDYRFWAARASIEWRRSPKRRAVRRVDRNRERTPCIPSEVEGLPPLRVASDPSTALAGAAWVWVNVLMQLTASAWASHLPHRPPRLMLKAARWLEWTRSAVVSSFLHHERHHRFPSIPCGQL